MARTFIERQDLGDPLSLTSAPQDMKHSAATVNRGYKQDATPIGPAENILGTLLEASGHVATTVGQQLTRKMEEDKTIQTMRFYEGMAPSDDATQAGYRAHAILGMSNSVLEETTRLKKEAETFTGTDDEWAEKVRTSQKSTLDSVYRDHPHLQRDPDTLKAVTTLYGEQVPQVAAARAGAKLVQEHEGRLVTFQDNLRLRTSSLTGEEKHKALDAVMEDAANAMQLTRKDREGEFTKLATERAKAGDLSFIEFSKRYMGTGKTSLFDRDATLQAAEREGQREYVRQHQELLAKDKQDLTTRLYSGGLTKEQFFEEAGRLNQKYHFFAYTDDGMLSATNHADSLNKEKPWMNQDIYANDRAGLQDQLTAGKFKGNRSGFFTAGGEINRKREAMVLSDNEMNAMWLQHEQATAQKADLHNDMQLILKSDQMGADPYALLVGDTQRKKAATEGVVKWFEDAAAAEIAKLPKGGTTQQQDAIRAQYRMAAAQKLAAAQVEYQPWTNQIAVLSTLDMENSGTLDKLPQAATNALNLYYSLPAGARELHSKDPAVKTILSNYEYFLQEGMTEVAALRQAQRAQKSPRTFTAKELSDINKEVNRVADYKTSSHWTPKFEGWKAPKNVLNPLEWLPELNFERTGHSAAPGWYQDLHRKTVREMVIANMQAGAASPKVAADMAARAFETNYTQLKNGVLVFGRRPELAAQMKVHPEDIETVMDTFMKMNKQVLESMGNVSTDEMYFEVQPWRGTFAVRSGLNGQYLTLPTPLNEMKRGAEAYIANNQSVYLKKTTDGMKDTLHAAQVYFHFRNPDGIAPSVALRQPERYPEQQELLARTLAMVENPDRVGYNKVANSYQPYNDNGGSAIGYGHRLTTKEMQQGAIVIDGTRYNIGNGKASQITEDVARRLMKRDLAAAEQVLRKNWKGGSGGFLAYDQLPFKYQGVLLNLQYNTGNALPSNWPLLMEAMRAGNDAAVRREMVTSYKDRKTGQAIPLSDRAKTVANRLGLK